MKKLETAISKLDITTKQWQDIDSLIVYSHEEQEYHLNSDTVFRFSQPQKNTYSALLSVNNLDAFHFMWRELPGVIDITHRIVKSDYRRQGIAQKMLKNIISRAHRLANQDQRPYLVIMETEQLVVVKLAQKAGLSVSKGQKTLQDLQINPDNYTIDEKSYIADHNNYLQQFRLSKLITPTSGLLNSRLTETRESLIDLLLSPVQ